MLALSLLTTSFQLQRAPLAHTITAARSSAVRMGEPGTPANIDDYKEYEFSKRKTTDDGSCFIVDDKEAPDPARSWFYCDDPNMDDEDMVCELVPEWMGTSPSGDHAVWLCSKPKPT